MIVASRTFRFRQLGRLIAAGGVVAYPTEAVYGLGCDPEDRLAVERILALKGRPVEKGLILVADDSRRFADWVDREALQAHAVQRTWPGPTTWILPAGPGAKSWITGAHDGVAVRVTAHPLAARLCAAAGSPVVSTSANRSGRPALRRAIQVRRVFGQAVDGVLSGATGGRRWPSEIRRYPDGGLVRDGTRGVR